MFLSLILPPPSRFNAVPWPLEDSGVLGLAPNLLEGKERKGVKSAKGCFRDFLKKLKLYPKKTVPLKVLI